MAVCLWPICRQTSRPTTSRHIYYTTAITRGNAHPGIQPPPSPPPPSSLPPRPSSHHRLVHARVGTTRSLWGLSRLATYSPLSLCTLRCMLRERAVFPALNFITCSRGTSKAARTPPMPTTYDFIKARRCTSYTRACEIIQFNACIHTAGQLLFRVRRPCFCEILGRRLRAEVTWRTLLLPTRRGPLSARYACSLSQGEILTLSEGQTDLWFIIGIFNYF